MSCICSNEREEPLAQILRQPEITCATERRGIAKVEQIPSLLVAHDSCYEGR